MTTAPAAKTDHDAALVEALAAYAHQAWARWMQYMLPRLEETHASGEQFLDRWQRQMNTPYAALSESEKASDRHVAQEIIAICQRLAQNEA